MSFYKPAARAGGPTHPVTFTLRMTTEMRAELERLRTTFGYRYLNDFLLKLIERSLPHAQESARKVGKLD